MLALVDEMEEAIVRAWEAQTESLAARDRAGARPPARLPPPYDPTVGLRRALWWMIC